MENKLVKHRIMRSVAIQQVNDATIVLRHFIELSVKLLPFLNELSSKERLSPHEYQDRQKIIEVYNSYAFDTSTSSVLMGSDILDRIQTTFQCIQNRIPGEPSIADELLDNFLDKHQELVQNWNKTDWN